MANLICGCGGKMIGNDIYEEWVCPACGERVPYAGEYPVIVQPQMKVSVKKSCKGCGWAHSLNFNRWWWVMHQKWSRRKRPI